MVLPAERNYVSLVHRIMEKAVAANIDHTILFDVLGNNAKNGINNNHNISSIMLDYLLWCASKKIRFGKDFRVFL
jgi:hypothetical protein